jgi:hypothetical protein
MTLRFDGRLVGRAISQTLDLLAPADRPGRWGPDPIGSALRRQPRAPTRSSCPAERQAMIGIAVAGLVGEFVERFGPDPSAIERVNAFLVKVAELVAVWETAMRDPVLGERVATLMVGLVDLVNRLAADLISSDDLPALVAAYSAVMEAAFSDWMAVVDEMLALDERGER